MGANVSYTETSASIVYSPPDAWRLFAREGYRDGAVMQAEGAGPTASFNFRGGAIDIALDGQFIQHLSFDAELQNAAEYQLVHDLDRMNVHHHTSNTDWHMRLHDRYEKRATREMEDETVVAPHFRHFEDFEAPALANGAHSAASTSSLPEVVIVSAARTPVGSFNGVLKKLTAPELGVVAVKKALEKAGVKPDQVEDVYFGNVLQAGVGQSPARQVALGAGCPDSTEATTINKVCASGMKAITLATQNLQLGQRSLMLAGGMESMSNSPFYFPRNPTYGPNTARDAIVTDGYEDFYSKTLMGFCTEDVAARMNITRENQDDFAIESYRRAAEAWKAGAFNDEIAPVTIKDPRKGDTVITEDEEFKNIKLDKVKGLKPVFKKDGGTITAANASSINDGASAVVLATREKADELGLKPLARVIAFADAACKPADFGIAPSLAVPIALKRAGLQQSDISLWEFNEAFSAVGLANTNILKLDPATVNKSGGAVALGHPIGSSGSRIVVTLVHALKSGQYGCAAVCNGGGGATAIIVQRI